MNQHDPPYGGDLQALKYLSGPLILFWIFNPSTWFKLIYAQSKTNIFLFYIVIKKTWFHFLLWSHQGFDPVYSYLLLYWRLHSVWLRIKTSSCWSRVVAPARLLPPQPVTCPLQYIQCIVCTIVSYFCMYKHFDQIYEKQILSFFYCEHQSLYTCRSCNNLVFLQIKICKMIFVNLRPYKVK